MLSRAEMRDTEDAAADRGTCVACLRSRLGIILLP